MGVSSVLLFDISVPYSREVQEISNVRVSGMCWIHKVPPWLERRFDATCKKLMIGLPMSNCPIYVLILSVFICTFLQSPLCIYVITL
jgi:hypothetical protein